MTERTGKTDMTGKDLGTDGLGDGESGRRGDLVT